MALPRIFETCEPRRDVLKGAITESDFAADLAQVLTGSAPEEYKSPARFFENTYPTRGLKSLLENVCRRLSGAGGEAAAIFRLDTQYGGGKTHGLIALVHAVQASKEIPTISEFVDPAILPNGKVRIAAFDGENADPVNGRRMKEGPLAYTPWGEIACALSGREGYERVRASDEQRVAPGAETLRELFGGEPTLILLDELSVYLRKVASQKASRDQLSAFLTSLFKAVEGAPNAALVYTLAIGRDAKASDAYSEENEFIASRIAEAESISARKATLLNPTEDDETAHVLRRRLFAKVDQKGAEQVIEAYKALWKQNASSLEPAAVRPETIDAFRASYPFHPEVLETLTEKVATLSNFQRVRGMLRLLARTIARTWKVKPSDAYAIHLHHIDPAFEPIRQELLTRLNLSQYAPALRRDIAGEGAAVSLAQEVDAENYKGMPPYASYVARTIFLHTLAFNDQLRGILPEHLRYSIIGPETDISFVEDARKRFIADSAFLDDRPGSPHRFLAEANLTQIIRRQESQADPDDVRAQLRDLIQRIFEGSAGATFDLVPFPSGAYEVPDDVGDGRPRLALLGYDAASVAGDVEAVPHLVERIFKFKGADEHALRGNRNIVAFLIADEARKDEMRRKMIRRLALRELRKADRLTELADHQQAMVKELEGRSEHEVAVAIQQCYRHVFYPSTADRMQTDIDLAHVAADVPSASAHPGSGQAHVVRSLRDNKKLRTPEDEPDSPAYIRDRTPLRKGEVTTAALREEFRRNPALPMLVRDDVFIKGIRRGVEQGEYVYRRGDLLFGKGDPQATIIVDEQSFVTTIAFAKEKGIWPRPAAKPIEPPAGESTPSRAQPPPTTEPAGTGTGPSPELFAEGVLKEALAQLWEKIRARKIPSVHSLRIRMYEAGDAFKLLGVIGTVVGAQKSVKLDGGYETTDGATLSFSFDGPATDAQPVKEFLDPQLRAAIEKNLTAEFYLKFDGGLAMNTDAPGKLTDRLTRYAAGTAYVTASAQTQAPAASGASL